MSNVEMGFRVKELAEAFMVSEQTMRNWVREVLPNKGETMTSGIRLLLTLDEVEAISDFKGIRPDCLFGENGVTVPMHPACKYGRLASERRFSVAMPVFNPGLAQDVAALKKNVTSLNRLLRLMANQLGVSLDEWDCMKPTQSVNERLRDRFQLRNPHRKKFVRK